MTDALLITHELLCALLIYSVFCRALRMDHTVRLDVRLVFFLLGVVACLGMPAPMLWPSVPNVFTVLLLAVIVLVQVVTARYWAQGVPYSFYKPECAPRRRACERKGAVCHG